MHLLFRPRVIEPLIAKHSFQLGRINVKVGRTYKAGQQRVSGGGEVPGVTMRSEEEARVRLGRVR